MVLFTILRFKNFWISLHNVCWICFLKCNINSFRFSANLWHASFYFSKTGYLYRMRFPIWISCAILLKYLFCNKSMKTSQLRWTTLKKSYFYLFWNLRQTPVKLINRNVKGFVRNQNYSVHRTVQQSRFFNYVWSIFAYFQDLIETNILNILSLFIIEI